MMKPRDWDGAGYDRVAAPMTRRGVATLARLPLEGDERVLDAGCGSGQVTAELLERLPAGGVVALDGSASMIEQVRARLGPDPRVEYVVGDLGQPLAIAPVDAMISTSTFHWVPDHDALWRNLADVIRTGGHVAVDCGGAGNIDSILRALHAVGETWSPWLFPTPEGERECLERAGFVVGEIWLEPDPVELEAGEPFRDYLRTVVLGSHLARLPQAEHESLLDRVIEQLPAPRLDYVRLKIVATRS